MISAFLRKGRRLLHDSVLRRWLIHRLAHASGRPPTFAPHRPPYLVDIDLAAIEREVPSLGRITTFRTIAADEPRNPFTVELPGQTVDLAPGTGHSLFRREFADIETQLAVYRFAWLPLAGEAVDPAWVRALWSSFVEHFGEPDASWAWHPYTAAERAINILDFARRHGLPGEPAETFSLLARHASAIAGRLEYFGDHDTSNHLANNGRGLYRLGLALGLPTATEAGRRILLAEAERIFSRSGALREGSTHYHLLLTRSYTDAFLAAQAHERPEAGALRAIVIRALSVLPHFGLPGGLPLIGDISPDCPPGFLSCLMPGGDLSSGWGALLEPGDRACLEALCQIAPVSSTDALARDGWARLSCGNWSALWHVAPDGWPPMPGHAHQDIGSFEAHWGAIPLFIDPGRGAYGETGEAGRYVSAAAHNSITIGGREPYPPNKPYYTEAFRRSVCGPPPSLSRRHDGVTLAFDGFSRFSQLGHVERDFRFGEQDMTIADSLSGKGHHRVVRRFHTPWPVVPGDGCLVIKTPAGDFRVNLDAPFSISLGKRWVAYGVERPSWIIEASAAALLPARLQVRVARL